MDDRLIFLYPHICEVMTKKANLSHQMERWHKRSSRCIGKSVHRMQDVMWSEWAT